MASVPICAVFADGPEARTGWIPQTRIAAGARPVDPAPPLAAWVGTWRQFDNKIELTRDGGRLRADGEAYWPGKSIMPANEDTFDGTTAPSGRRVQFGEDTDPCVVVLILAGDFLFAHDRRMCSGHNASFNGIYVRQPEGRKKAE